MKKAIERLRTQLTGHVIEPGGPDYDTARQVFVGGIDRKPACIARVASSADVARTIEFARNTGLELAVRSGGHSAVGHSVTEGGVVIDLRDMRSMRIDAQNCTASAETGLSAREYSDIAHGYGLATGFGDTGSVGIGGITLGGGVGYLSRKHGLTIDSLLGAEVVTADGEIIRVDGGTHPDLFWAIRGGGGNFGVATNFDFRLQEVGGVFGGMLMLPATADAIASFVAAATAAPDELSTIANVMPAPPMPFVPAEYHGRLVIMAMLVYAGGPDAGERAVAPFRALAEPIVDMLRSMPYPEIYPPEDPNYHPTVIGRNMFRDTLERRAAETIVEQLETSKAKFQAAQIRVLGGAIARVPSDATAYAHRARRIMVQVVAGYETDDEVAACRAWADHFLSALREGEPGVYVNFLADDGPARLHEAYPGRTWDRLTAIKAKYDPTNVFRANQNVAPAESAVA